MERRRVVRWFQNFPRAPNTNRDAVTKSRLMTSPFNLWLQVVALFRVRRFPFTTVRCGNGSRCNVSDLKTRKKAETGGAKRSETVGKSDVRWWEGIENKKEHLVEKEMERRKEAKRGETENASRPTPIRIHWVALLILQVGLNHRWYKIFSLRPHPHSPSQNINPQLFLSAKPK